MAVVPPQADKSNNPPIPPPEAVRLRQQGSVTLRIHVAGDGYVTAVDVTEASGYPLLDNAARMAVFAWHYKPGRGADGNPAPSTVEVIIEFTQ